MKEKDVITKEEGTEIAQGYKIRAAEQSGMDFDIEADEMEASLGRARGRRRAEEAAEDAEELSEGSEKESLEENIENIKFLKKYTSF